MSENYKSEKNSSLPNFLPPERNFGLLFIFFFGVLGVYGYIKNHNEFIVFMWLLICVALIPITLLRPILLKPFNRAWYKIGHMIGKIVSPVVLGIMFYFLITPVALIGKIVGRDELRLKKHDGESYWIHRNPHEPTPDTFKNQF